MGEPCHGHMVNMGWEARMGKILTSVCRRCSVPITVDADEYAQEGEYVYWYPTDEAQAQGLGDDCYCADSVTQPHQPGDEIAETDDGYREVNLSAPARAVIAAFLVPGEEINRDGVYAADETWAELRSAFPRELFDQWLASLGPRDELGLNAEGVGYHAEAGM